MNQLSRKVFFACLVMSAAAISSRASVAVNSEGIGFVGKGDVQTVLALNNSQMQTLINNKGVSFTYASSKTYNVVTAWATGNIDNPVSLKAHSETVTTFYTVTADLAFDPRKGPNQYTGFNLKGLSTVTVPVTQGAVPQVSTSVIYTPITWTEQVWTKTFVQVPVYKNGVLKGYTNGDKIYVTVTHSTDLLPAYLDENGNPVLYTEGNNKAILSANVVDSSETLYVNGIELPITPVVTPVL